VLRKLGITGYAEVLVERDSLNYLTPLIQMVVDAVRPLRSLLGADKTGSGVPHQEYGADFREGQAGMNRAPFLKEPGTRIKELVRLKDLSR
jgi:hypothetical protein